MVGLDRRGRLAAPLAVAALTLLVFWPCLRLGIVNADDPVFLAPSALALGAASLRRLLFSAYFTNYSPLPQLTLAIDAALWGGRPLGYHLTNIVFHTANAVAFYALCLELFTAGKPDARSRVEAAASALLFSLHPLRVESVAWVSERRDVVCGLFFIATLWLWLRSQRPGQTNAWKRRWLALGTFLLALLSKAAALPLPLVLILLSIHPLKRSPGSRVVWRDVTPFFVLAAAFFLITLFAHSEIIGLSQAVPLQRAHQVLIGLVFYLGKTIWPSGLAFYEWHWAPVKAATLLGAAATAGLLLAAAVSRRWRPHIFAALVYQTLMLAPTLGFITIGHELVADRYSYLACLSWAALAGVALRGLATRRDALAGGMIAVTLALLASATIAQIGVWKDSAALWRQTLLVDPWSYGARPNMAQYFAAQGRPGAAIAYLEDHLRLYPQDQEVKAELAAARSAAAQ